MSLPILLLILYVILNAVSFLSYGLDKRKAVKDRWRIKESTLLILGLLGPWGAVCGMYTYHHKTRKPVFKLNFLFLAVHIVLLALVLNRYVL